MTCASRAGAARTHISAQLSSAQHSSLDSSAAGPSLTRTSLQHATLPPQTIAQLISLHNSVACIKRCVRDSAIAAAVSDGGGILSARYLRRWVGSRRAQLAPYATSPSRTSYNRYLCYSTFIWQYGYSWNNVSSLHVLIRRVVESFFPFSKTNFKIPTKQLGVLCQIIEYQLIDHYTSKV